MPVLASSLRLPVPAAARKTAADLMRCLFPHGKLVCVASLILVLVALRSYYLCSPYVCPKGRTVANSPYASSYEDHRGHAGAYSPPPAVTGESDKVLVVASTQAEDTAWFHEYFPDWQKKIYVMDDASANLTVARNVGRESTAYLTYIIDHYHDLPSFMFFLHASRYQWHNEDPIYDGVQPIRNLRLAYVQEQGYANLRCTWSLGCPTAIRPFSKVTKLEAALEPHNDRANTVAAFAQAYMEIFPGASIDDVPSAIGVPCCAQFALAKWAVEARPREDYVRIRDWLWTTKLPDSVSGRILEYVWHILMGKPAEYCPDARECFCLKFGFCDLECRSPGSCEKRYRLPQHEEIPPNWPEEGFGTMGFPEWGWWE
ncbi:hypothetical protein FH972_022896 [Carpinus fangiana]|uniref:Uncharacterized protein n=1 Tax=Carpinus fangiana TaxID=176857 RepID=A0A5N6KTY6_9ROSI|nr:hypothetical protein FH972_022896 [Carpinus fangiana]